MVQIKHFVAFILAAATVIAPVAAKKKAPVELTGDFRSDSFGNVFRVKVQVGKDKAPIYYEIETETGSGELKFSGVKEGKGPFHTVEPRREIFHGTILNKTETTLKAKTKGNSRLGPTGTILDLKLVEKFVRRDYSEMFVRFFGNT